MEIETEITGLMAKFGGYVVLVISIVAVCLLAWYIFSRRYPRITFEIYDGKRKSVEYRRLYGDKIVEDNLIQVILFGERLLGFKIDEFDHVYIGNEKRYLATTDGQGNLVPLRIENTALKIGELGTAKEIAIRYINAIDSAKEDLKKENPILLALISVIPIAVLVLVSGVVFYLILNDALPKIIGVYSEISQTSLQVAQLSKQTAEYMMNTTQHMQAMPPPNISEYPLQNGTIVIQR